MSLSKMMTMFLSPDDAGGGAAAGAAAGATSSLNGTGGAAGAGTGASNGGAAAGGSSAGNGAASAGTSSQDWTHGFNDDQKGYIGNKGFKTPADLVESYRNLEKLRGVPQERLLTLPERFYDDAGKLTAEGRAIREKIGAPKEAKEYNLAMPKEGGDAKLTEHFRGLFHELGLPKADAEKIQGAWNTYAEQRGNAAKEAAVALARDQQAALAKEWGAATEQNINIAKDAIRAMGVKPEIVTALENSIGHHETAKLFHKLGTQVREAPFIGGSKPDAILEPVNAQQTIKDLRSDKEFGKRLLAGDKDAQAKWQRLHEQAYPGEVKTG